MREQLMGKIAALGKELDDRIERFPGSFEVSSTSSARSATSRTSSTTRSASTTRRTTAASVATTGPSTQECSTSGVLHSDF